MPLFLLIQYAHIWLTFSYVQSIALCNKLGTKEAFLQSIHAVTKNYRKFPFTNVGKSSSRTVNQHLGLYRKAMGHKGGQRLEVYIYHGMLN